MDINDLLISSKPPDDKTSKSVSKKDISQHTKQQSKLDDVGSQNNKQNSSISSNGLNDYLTIDDAINMIKKVYKENQTRSMKYNKTMLSPSDLCGYCPRKVYFRLINAEYELNLFYPYSELIMHVGNKVHEWFQKYLKEVYFPDSISEYRFELKNDRLKGFIDFVYTTKSGKTVILELKTIGDEIHDETFYGKIPHWKQVAIYYWVWVEKLGNKCDLVQLMYIKRDFKPVRFNNKKYEPIKIFNANPVKLWNTYKDELLYNYNVILKALDENKPPIIENTSKLEIIKREECSFCPYQKICSQYPILHHDTIKIENIF